MQFLIFLSQSLCRILPSDNAVIFLRLRKQLYISLDEGRAVLNNSILDENSLDVALPTSTRRINETFDAILIDGSPICSFGLFKDVAECTAAKDGEDRWIFNGSEDEFTIEGKGGCITKYTPESINTDFKHGLRIEFCNESDDQKFLLQRLASTFE
jgi:hypothetical protein